MTDSPNEIMLGVSVSLTNKKTSPDFLLVVITLLLLTIGLIMVYSASAVWASYKFDDSFYFAKRQLLFAGIGVIAMFFIMRVDYWTWRTWSKILIAVCFLLCCLYLFLVSVWREMDQEAGSVSERLVFSPLNL